MPTRVLVVMMVLFAASTATAAPKHSRARTTLRLPDRSSSSSQRGAASNNRGARLDSSSGCGFALSPPVNASPTFVELHSARVANNLILFQPTLVGITSLGRKPELFAPSPAKSERRFFAAAPIADDLEVRRDRDRLLLFREPQPQGAAVGLGMAMFGAMTVLSAHAPRFLRFIFDGPVHLGPAIFDGGGMGAGIAGRGF